MELQQDFKELLKLLNSNKVKCIIVGGYALAFHGSPRLTGDIDIFIERTAENAKNIISALDQFGLGSLDLKEEDFTLADQVIQLGLPPLRIDFLTSLEGLEWDEVNSTKNAGLFDDVPVYYIGREQLIKNKRALGRAKDLADIEALDGH